MLRCCPLYQSARHVTRLACGSFSNFGQISAIRSFTVYSMLKPSQISWPSREPSPFASSAVDKENVTKPDDEFVAHTWEDVKSIIADNRLELFRRRPSDIRRYLEWSSDIRHQYGSIQNFVMKNRLGWSPSPQTTAESGPLFEYAHATPFYDSRDYKTLRNDWPYGFESGVAHLIVWLKTRLDIEPTRGDVTPKARLQVEDFVQRMFVDRIKHLPDHEDRIRWFKNWTGLQSVPGMDHVHVLARDVPDDIVQSWIADDAEPGQV